MIIYELLSGLLFSEFVDRSTRFGVEMNASSG